MISIIGLQMIRGRPKIDPDMERLKCNNFRLPRWIIDWINRQTESGGKLIERALIKFYRLREPHDEKKKD